MHVMPATAGRFGVAADTRRTVAQKLLDPALNVSAGTRYLHYLLDLFPGRLDLALAAYNAGEGAVQRAGNRIPAYKETQNYVRTVLGLYAQLKPPAPVLAQRAGPGRVRMELSGGALNRGNLPAIKLNTTRRRAGEGLRVGKYFFRGAFIQQLANGRWHVLRRLPEARFATGHDHQGRPRKNRLPVEVVKIPLSGPLTQAFEDARDRIIAAEMPKQLGYALKQQLRLWLTR